jgi:protein-disulfide isomerase
LSTESKLLTGVLVAVVAGMIGLFVLANKPTNSGPAPVGDKTKVVRDSSHKEGSGSVQFVEFGDFQCPACGAAEPNVEQAMKEFNGKVTFYFRNFPLTTLHQNAMTAAQAAEAAGDQGKYWEMHDKLYQTQKEWETLSDPTDKFTEYAKGLGLDGDKFKQAVQDEKFKQVIQQDMADGNALNINATPTFFINGAQVTGGYDYANLRDKLQAAVGSAAPAPTASPAQ